MWFCFFRSPKGQNVGAMLWFVVTVFGKSGREETDYNSPCELGGDTDVLNLGYSSSNKTLGFGRFGGLYS